MNVLYIADTASWHNALWLRYFASRHTCAIASDHKPEAKPVHFPDEAQVFEFRFLVRRGSRHLRKILGWGYYLYCCWRLARTRRPDLIHSVAIYYGVLGGLVAWMVRVPFVYTLQGSEVLIRAQANPLYRLMLGFVMWRAEAVTGDSATILNAATALGLVPRKRHLIQNGVRLDVFRPDITGDSRRELLARLNIADTGGWLVFSPRALTPLYNIDTIVRAVARLRRQGKDVTLLLAYGFGEEELPRLRALADALGISDHCHWLGYVDHVGMVPLYRAVDAVVSIPTSDSSPKSVYEAMACMRPVVVSDLPWIGEYFAPAGAVYVTPAIAEEQVAGTLARAVDDLRHGRPDVLQRAADIVARDFSYDANMCRMERIMLELTGGGTDGHG